MLVGGRCALLPCAALLFGRAAPPRMAAKKEIASFKEVKWPDAWPFADPRFFARADESSDGLFYEQPRFVTHIDDGAIAALTEYYRNTLPAGSDLLDVCSSWICARLHPLPAHIPPAHVRVCWQRTYRPTVRLSRSISRACAGSTPTP